MIRILVRTVEPVQTAVGNTRVTVYQDSQELNVKPVSIFVSCYGLVDGGLYLFLEKNEKSKLKFTELNYFLLCKP